MSELDYLLTELRKNTIREDGYKKTAYRFFKKIVEILDYDYNTNEYKLIQQISRPEDVHWTTIFAIFKVNDNLEECEVKAYAFKGFISRKTFDSPCELPRNKASFEDLLQALKDKAKEVNVKKKSESYIYVKMLDFMNNE